MRAPSYFQIFTLGGYMWHCITNEINILKLFFYYSEMKEGKIYRPSHNVVILKPVWYCAATSSATRWQYVGCHNSTTQFPSTCIYFYLVFYLFIHVCMYLFIWTSSVSLHMIQQGRPLFRPHVKPLGVDSAEGHFREMTQLLWLSLILSNPPLRRRRRNLIPPQQLWKNTTDSSRVNICLVFCGVKALQCFLVRKRC